MLLFAALIFLGRPASAATTSYTSAYSGGTIAVGDLVVLGMGAYLTGSPTLQGELNFNQTGLLTVTNPVHGTGSLSISNTGTLLLSRSNIVRGGTYLTGSYRVVLAYRRSPCDGKLIFREA